ncbi:MAG: ParB/RepB/Spo0J family partition protein [Deltaproteobacteria bacterium]|jgi:ParB family chromosome partitioning protein|nr:ParB/RepB/Spo0J family partition protein [Deltaproteobacteria bacterium]
MSDKRKQSMGMGLNDLIGKNVPQSGLPLYISIESISLNPDQPRKYFNSVEMENLTESIKLKGIIEPLIVRTAETGYQLIAGHRRLIAAKNAQLNEVPVIIREVPDSSKERLELALIENIFRDNLNPIEEAEAVLRLKDELNETLPNISKLIGKDRTTVSGILRLLGLPEKIKDDIRYGRMSAGHGKAILSIDDKEKWEEARSLIISGSLTVREAEALAKKLNKPAKTREKDNEDSSEGDSAYYESLENSFTEAIGGLKVKIKYKGKDKKIEIHYTDNKEIEMVMKRLGVVVA